MDLFSNIPNIPEKKLHPKFVRLRDGLPIERIIVSEWAQDIVDRDNKFAQEFQTTFHSSFFELYLHHYFSSINFQLDYSHNRPDFIISKPKEFYVEAVVANIKKDGPPEELRTDDDLCSMFTPPWDNPNFTSEMDEAIIRYSSAVNSKKGKYDKQYSKLSWVKPDTPFVIAIASFDQINYGREYIYPMMALLYGYYYDVKNKAYISKDSIYKLTAQPGKKAPIELGLFNKPEYKNISAILYTSTLTLGKLTSLAKSKGLPVLSEIRAVRENCSGYGAHYQLQIVNPECPEILSDGVFIFHNPLATNPIDEQMFMMTTQFFLEENEINILGIETPLIARLNTVPGYIPNFKITEAIRRYNEKEFSEFYDVF